MRFEVGTVKTATRLTLGVSILACGYGFISHKLNVETALPPPGATVHFFVCFGLTLLGFAAYPHSRRTDLVKQVIVAAALLEIAEALLGRGLHVEQLVADVAGAYAVLATSFLERFRSLTRADPHEPFSMVYPNDKRRLHRKATSEPGKAMRPLISGGVTK